MEDVHVVVVVFRNTGKARRLAKEEYKEVHSSESKTERGVTSNTPGGGGCEPRVMKGLCNRTVTQPHM